MQGSKRYMKEPIQYSNILIYIQQDATLHSLFYLETAPTCFRWYHHPSSGAQTTVSTASGICQTAIAICRYHGRVTTALSVHVNACVRMCMHMYLSLSLYTYTGCPRRNVPDFGRVFLMLKYIDITQNTYIQS